MPRIDSAMEMAHQSGPEGESLLRPDQRNVVVMPHNSNKTYGWEAPEKAPFLQNEPVKLTPAWEGTNLPNDTLNLKGIAMDLVPPRDKWNLIYLTLVLHGLGTLTAWNMFITAKDYFVKYKLVNDKEGAANFLPYIGFASQIPNLLFSWFNVFVQFGGDLSTRVVWSLSVEVFLFVLTVILAMIDTSQWTEIFFWLTIVILFIMNTFNAIFQNSVYGIAARLPPQYTGAVVLGSNICGTLVVLLGWLSDVFSDSYRTSAIYYFIGGMLILLACFDTYFALPLNRFYRYHDTLQQRTLRLNPTLAATAQNARRRRPPYWTIFKQCWVQLYNVFLIFFVTLAVFPAVHSDIKPVGHDFLAPNFTRITCFLTFNLTAMLGNITASICPYPTRKWLTVFTTLRVLFIPLFLLCNYQPLSVVRTLPVLIKDDWVYWVLAILMGWSSGHGSSLGMMFVGGNVAPENAATAGMMGGATLVTGLIAGITVSRFCPIVVGLDFWKTI